MTTTLTHLNAHSSLMDDETLLNTLISHRDYCKSLLSDIFANLSDTQRHYLTAKYVMLSNKINRLTQRMVKTTNPA